MENQQPKRHARLHRGTIVSDAMDKTVVVEVVHTVWHTKYRKQYRTSKRFKVHDEKNAYHVGDVVEFAETRPISKQKRWRVLRKLER